LKKNRATLFASGETWLEERKPNTLLLARVPVFVIKRATPCSFDNKVYQADTSVKTRVGTSSTEMPTPVAAAGVHQKLLVNGLAEILPDEPGVAVKLGLVGIVRLYALSLYPANLSAGRRLHEPVLYHFLLRQYPLQQALKSR
jgi:hypothetical protein